MKHPNIKLLLLVLITVLISCEPQKEQVELSGEQKTIIENLMARAKVPGLQLGFFNGNKEWVYAGGYSNLSDAAPISTSTVFRANDLGYSIIAALCFRLAEENELDLTQAITEDFQDPRLGSSTFNHLVSYQNLLSHTSGLPIWSEAEDTISITNVPGETWNYSHLGYEWIIKGLEAKFNTSIQQLANQWVFDPLDMSSSFFGNAEPSNAAKGHDLIGRVKAPGRTNTSTFYTNVGDYLNVIRAFSEGFFSDESQKALAQSLAKVNVWEDETSEQLVSWGPGLGIQTGNGGVALWQYSDDLTMKSFSIVFPERNTGLVLLTNSENGLSIGENLSGLFFDDQLPALDWLDLQPYDDPSWQARLKLESAFAFDDSLSVGATYNDLFENQPDELNNALFNNVIWSFFKRNELDAAERLARIHLEYFPSTANTYIRLGETLGFKNEYGPSWENYQKAMELDPETSRLIMPRFPWYTEATIAMQETQELPLSLFVGNYGKSTVSIANNQLILADGRYEQVDLKRIGNTLFDLNAAETYRINFTVSDGVVIGLEKSYLSGERVTEMKNPI